ncbi:MAG: dTDP-glucose 4,6-dehydratase [Anaerolineales bacterium]|nr:MAG: dTDP-glucose 4,6-dehydratase [Anaerolineales bacterium]
MNIVLVTGGAGFIGSNFIHHVLRVEPDVRIINFDVLTYAGSLENLKDVSEEPRYTFVRGDICDTDFVEKLLDEHAIDTIVHFAAESHVDRSILGPRQFIETNVMGTFSMLEAARRIWLQHRNLPLETVRFHHVSTDEVFGSLAPAEPAWTEETPYAPSSPYAASKASSDHLVRSYGHTYGLPFTITNCSNNYGPWQFPEKLIPLMILNAVEGKPLPVYGDGQQIRDWLHVQDHCEAIHLVLKKGVVGSTYNIGGENQPANLTIVETICEILDEVLPSSPHKPHKKLIQFVKDRPGHDRRYDMDTYKISTELGWRPRHTLAEGLLDTVNWYLSHPEWVTAIRGQHKYQGWLDANYKSR